MSSENTVSGDRLREFLSQTRMFRKLDPDSIAAVEKIAMSRSFRKHETIFLEGDNGEGFFVVVSGRVKVFKTSADGKEHILQFFGSGEHFAEVPAFDGECYPVSAATLEPTQLLFFPRHALLKLLQTHPNLAINILEIFARHLRHFAQKIEDLSLKAVPARLAAYLLYLSDREGQPNRVELDTSKGQLAAFLGTIPETLSRVFNKLEHEGAIAIRGATVRLLDPDKLRQIADMNR